MEETQEVEKEIEHKKQKIFDWLKKPYNAWLVIVMAFAFIVRFYYFRMTKLQPLWWDEGVYGSLTKNIIYHTWDGIRELTGEIITRPPGFPFLWSVLVRLGIQEPGVRFILEFIPSILSVFFVYLIAKEIYNKKIGLIAAFMFSSLWIHLFYTARLLSSVPALVFLFASFYYFIKALKSEFNYKYFIISFILLGISTLIRYPNGLFFFAYLIIFVIDKRLPLIKKSKLWVSAIIGLAPLLIFFVYNYIKYQNIFPAFFGDYLKVSGSDAGQIDPFGFHLLNFIPQYLQKTFLIFFIIGLGLILFELLISYNYIFKSKKLKNNLFLILILIIPYAFFIFVLRAAEDRYFLATALPLFCFAAFGLNYIANIIKKYNKQVAFVFIIVVLIWGAHSQITFADELINLRKTSFSEMRQGFEWIEQNTPRDSTIAGNGIHPYLIYYAERVYHRIPENATDFEKMDSDYLVYHFFVPQREFLPQYIQENQDKWELVHALFFDPQQTRPAFIVYRRVRPVNQIKVSELV